MYIHLGRDYVLNYRDVIGIFNLETTTISPSGREFLNYAQKNGAVVSLSDELPQSYVLAAGGVVDTVYLSERSRAVLRRRFNGPRQIFKLLLLVSALLVFTDWFNGYTGYSLDLVVPILCCVALVCNFIFAFLRSRFTANALVYLLMNIGIGVLPYILLFFRIDYSGRLDAHSLPWVICLIVSVITFLGLVIFRGRALKNEIVKRLHM